MKRITCRSLWRTSICCVAVLALAGCEPTTSGALAGVLLGTLLLVPAASVSTTTTRKGDAIEAAFKKQETYIRTVIAPKDPERAQRMLADLEEAKRTAKERAMPQKATTSETPVKSWDIGGQPPDAEYDY